MRIADNAPLLPLIEMLWRRMAPLATDTLPRLRDDVFRARWIAHHDALISAFQLRDASAAEQAMLLDVLAPSAAAGYWKALGLASD